MTAIQTICARIGRVTGEGLAANMLHVLPRWLVTIIVSLLLLANTVNIGADIAAMGAAVQLVTGWGDKFFAILLAVGSLALQVFVPYHHYVHVLKWLTLALFAYVGVLFTVDIDWVSVVRGTVWPQIAWSRDTLTVVVAVFGTTISPYLFFWQSAEEVEDAALGAGKGSLLDHPEDAPAELGRIAWDSYIGMGFSNLVAFFIFLTTAVTLNKAGITDIATSAQVAQALRPIAGSSPSRCSAWVLLEPGFWPCRFSPVQRPMPSQNSAAGALDWNKSPRTQQPSMASSPWRSGLGSRCCSCPSTRSGPCSGARYSMA
jgi:Mn2+/Fe2+ NRAMP family transporter